MSIGRTLVKSTIDPNQKKEEAAERAASRKRTKAAIKRELKEGIKRMTVEEFQAVGGKITLITPDTFDDLTQPAYSHWKSRGGRGSVSKSKAKFEDKADTVALPPND